jgi:hypothetical protein
MSIDLDPDMKIQTAAEFLAGPNDRDAGRAIVPELQQRFGLSAAEAVEAIRLAQSIRLARAI